MKVDIYSEKGTKLQKKAELPNEIFKIKPNETALRQYLHTYQVNQRQGTAAAKTRAAVRGGGKKPWAQKGTGRARHGSIRSPIWVGGGVAHGPRPRELGASIPKKVRNLALRSALSVKASADRVYVVEKFAPSEPKTALAVGLLRKLGLEKPFVITAQGDEVVRRSFRNIPGAGVGTASTVNPYEVVKADSVVLLRESVDVLRERLVGKEVSKPAASAAKKRGVRGKKRP
ncbi:MAG: 50S ribosomal protein L4 [Patescibacteria group bacterium]|nr:MAG: 50S ribosomal protein L4 [Patescibacteria group bacterium]